jgi:uncharacterized protein YqgC (DUF456 family)
VPDPTLLLIVAFVLVAVGLMGTVLPALPGVPLVFLGLALAAWAEGFRFVGAGTLTVLGLMALLAYGVDLVAGALGAKKFGASRLAMLGAAIGTVAGLFLGLPGLILGPFVGGAAGELYARRDLRQAGRAGLGAWLGLVVGGATKLALSFSMLAIFLAKRLL